MNTLKRRLDDYFPEYLAHHRHPMNRALHSLGDVVVIAGVGGAVASGAVWPIAVGLAAGYALAFAGHHFVEGNRPATLDRPVLAGLSNWRMFYHTLRGTLHGELARAVDGRPGPA